MYQLPTLTAPLQHRLLRGGEEIAIDVRSASVTRPAGAGQGITLGDAPAAQLTLTAGAGLHEGEEIAYQVGDGENWVPIGVFTILTAQGVEGIYTYTGADAMAVSMEHLWLAEECATAFEVLRSVAAQCGLTFRPGETLDDPIVDEAIVDEAVVGGGSGESTLADITLTQSPAAGPTCRELAGQMAALLGGNAVIDRSGRLTVLVWDLTKERTALTTDEIYAGEAELSARSYTIQSVSCTVVASESVTDEDGITTEETTSETLQAGTSGAYGFAIANPYMTQELLDEAFARLEGQEYYGGTVGFVGRLELDPGDLVQVADREGNQYLLPVMELRWELDGGLRSAAESFIQPEADVQADYAGPTAQAIQRLTAELASFKQLYATNIRAEMGQFKSLVTDDLSAVTINASKYITGVTIIGDLIKANTLSAKKIILEGADGLFYELNTKAGTLTAEQLTDEQYQQKLDGSVLVANSITADKINVTDLFAQDIVATGSITGLTLYATAGTIGGWEIREDGLYHEMEDGAITIRPAEGIDRVIEIYTDDADGRNTFFVDTAARMGVTVARVSELVFQNPGAMEVEDPVMGMLLRYGTADGAGIRCTSDFHVDDVLYNGGLAVPQMQHGRLTLASTAGQTATAFSVTFPTAFEGVPDVTLTPRHNSTIRVFCKLKTVTATGFTGDIYVDNTGTNSVTVHWMAMY